MIVFPRASLGRVEGGDGIVEGRNGADVRPQSSVPHSLDDLTQLGAIGLDNEVDRQAVDGPRLRRSELGEGRRSGGQISFACCDVETGHVAPVPVVPEPAFCSGL
jgi:hypothetical protein